MLYNATKYNIGSSKTKHFPKSKKEPVILQVNNKIECLSISHGLDF